METRQTFPCSFGELLKTSRKRQHLTQKDLAQQLGVHTNTVSSWELGTYLPATRGLVLELARLLVLNEPETRQLLEASLTALSPHWYVPFPRNPFFTGREEILEALYSHLHAEQMVALTQSYALHGLGGIGKTQLALEYAYRHALEHSAVFWIGAETIEHIVSDLLRIAGVLQLPGRDDKDQQQVVEAVQLWLTTHSQWLLIWDNLEDLAMLERFLPSARQGAILITTRHQALGTLARGMDLFPMEREEGMLFLLRRAKVLEPEATSEQMHQLAVRMPPQYAAAADLVSAMGGLPLAIDQAGAYIEETQCGLPAYLELFRTRRAILLQQRGDGSRDHPASVSATFTLAIAATAQRHPAVRDLLQVCALLQPDAIPEELFRQGAEHLGTTLEAVGRDALDWDRVVAVSCSYSLLRRQPEEQMLSMHRLVQAILLDAMTETERETWTRRAIGALDAVFPEVRPATEYAAWKQCERLLPQALLCLHRVEATEESLAVASLAYKTAQYLRERERYAEAEPLFQRALHLREQALGLDHPDVAFSLNYLAVLYWEQGRYAEAEPLDQRALRIWEQALGPDHPDLARPLNNMAVLYLEQGRYAEAEPLFQQALRLREQALDSDYPLLAYPLHGLAELYFEQGRYAEAEPLFRQALRVWEQALGPDHPQVAEPLNGLAELSFRQGKYAEAELLFQRALRNSEQSQGLEHLNVATSLNGLANLFREQGKYTEAKSLFQQALSIREKHLGQRHPETARTLHDLAILCQKQNNLSEAVSLAERALKIRLESLGDAHPKAIATRVLYVQLVQFRESDEEGGSCPRDPGSHRAASAGTG
ncbi:MAG TPA: tetratricopeptide repeat protein [Ktedonobacteraceae bacterium]|nr:tetratricopeptide repeat protein [Ktedonobacteraceae bacterium]